MLLNREQGGQYISENRSVIDYPLYCRPAPEARRRRGQKAVNFDDE